jgi:hypothetical protein
MPKVKETPVKSKPVVQESKVNKNVSPIIASSVLSLLGKPKNLYDIVVKPLWDNRYRVNVWCHVTEDGREITALYDPKLITDSFFIHSNPVGDILASFPQIIKKYDNDNPVAKIKNAKKYNISDIMKP